MSAFRLNHAYNSDFDAAETQFDQIYKLDPSRTDNLETYSNILYVMGNRAKLSQLAHHYMRVDRNRPETCCLIGKHSTCHAAPHASLKLRFNQVTFIHYGESMAKRLRISVAL